MRSNSGPLDWNKPPAASPPPPPPPAPLPPPPPLPSPGEPRKPAAAPALLAAATVAAPTAANALAISAVEAVFQFRAPAAPGVPPPPLGACVSPRRGESPPDVAPPAAGDSGPLDRAPAPGRPIAGSISGNVRYARSAAAWPLVRLASACRVPSARDDNVSRAISSLVCDFALRLESRVARPRCCRLCARLRAGPPASLGRACVDFTPAPLPRRRNRASRRRRCPLATCTYRVKHAAGLLRSSLATGEELSDGTPWRRALCINFHHTTRHTASRAHAAGPQRGP